MRETRKGTGWLANLAEGIRIALDALRANKVRSGLTILGVTIGVMVVMVIAAMIQGLNDSFSEAISSSGPNTFYVTHSPPGEISGPFQDQESEWLKNPPLDPTWAQQISQMPQIRDAVAIADLSQFGYQAGLGSDLIQIALVAVPANYLEIDGGGISDGRFFTAAEAEQGRPVAVMDSAATVDLFGRRDPLGRSVDVQGQGNQERFDVIGTYKRPQNLFAGFSSHYVLVPFEAAWKYLNFWDRMVSFVVRPKPGVPQVDAMDAVRGRMRQLRGLRPGEKANFYLVTQEEVQDLWNRLTGVLFAVMFALSSVGLLVGGIGVVGIMMISVTERTREIGLRKAMGARRRDVLWQFLVEAATLTLVGGALGLLLGGGIVYLVTTLTPLPAHVPLWSIGAALGVSALTGVGFGLYPASRGARMDPVDALRYE